MDRRNLLKTAGATAAVAGLAGVSSVAGGAPATAASLPLPVLPQKDSLVGSVLRSGQLAESRLRWLWTTNAPNLKGVPMAAHVPYDDLPTLEWLILAVRTLVDLVENFVVSVLPRFDDAVVESLPGVAGEMSALSSRLDELAGQHRRLLGQAAGAAPSVTTLAQLTLLRGEIQLVIAETVVVRTRVTQTVQQAFTRNSGLGEFGRADGLARYDALWATMPVPSVREKLHDDATFARMRVAGPNPCLIERVRVALPSKFRVTEADYQQVMGPGDSLADAVAEKRLYYVDYAGLGAMAPDQATYKLLTGEGWNSAPMALFVVPRGEKSLVPVAIQCGQDPDESLTVLRSVDEDASSYWSWQMAKTVVQTADFNYHEMFTHLARTHLVSEAFAVATRRHLAERHPLHQLLVPHFEGDLFINELAALIIMSPQTFADWILAAPIADIQSSAGGDRLAWEFDKHLPPVDFAHRGVDDAAALPDYPYRDDALLVWGAIRSWTEEYVRTYYLSDADVVADIELRGWTSDLVNQGKVKGLSAIVTRSQLADTVAMVIFTASAQHAAVNYPQKHLMTYAPFFAGVSSTQGPTAAEGETEEDWLAMLPDMFAALSQMYFLNLLGGVSYRPLGDYRQNSFPYLPALADPKIAGPGGPLRRFQASLKEVEATINARNATRDEPYEYLLPSLIPTSTNI